jgi:hypothetical protein
VTPGTSLFKVIRARPVESLCLTVTMLGLDRRLELPLFLLLRGLPTGVALSVAMHGRLVKTGTCAFVPVLRNRENAIPATRRARCGVTTAAA